MKTYPENRHTGPFIRRGAAACVAAGVGLILALAGGYIGLILSLAGGDVGGEVPDGHESGLPGMCNGRSDADVVVNAHARKPKFILNVATDGFGVPTGVLIFSQGADRLYADLFCRVWQHLPGQPSGGNCGSGGEEEHVPEGAVIVHAVGLGRLRDGTEIVVRADARETEEGRFFRIRYRPLGGGHDDHETVLPAAHEDGEDCEGGGWVRYPVEGWAPLNQLKVRTVTE